MDKFLNIRRPVCLLLLLSLFIPATPSHGQNKLTIIELERKLANYFVQLEQSRVDSTRFRINDTILMVTEQALTMPEAIDYPFDSLKKVAKIGSDDKKFRIIHWNIQQQNGIHRYFGFLQFNVNGQTETQRLHDRSDTPEGSDSLILSTGNWFGALYYRVISGQTASGFPMYTLLGWSGEDFDITSKVIEILTFENNVPRFGLPVFMLPDSWPRSRIIFRYSAGETMVLKYEEQVVKSSKTWNPKKRAFEEKTQRDHVIVFDHLVPIDPVMEGQPKYSIPAGDDYDGFIMSNGRWNFLRGIESRNNPR